MSVAGSVADPAALKAKLLDQLKATGKRKLQVVDVRSSSQANQQFATADFTVISAATAPGGQGGARLLITGVVTSMKFGDDGEVFNAIASNPPTLLPTKKVENPAGRAAVEKKQMPMQMAFNGAVCAIGGNKASTFVKKEWAVQSPDDLPAGTRVVLSGVHTGSFGKTDDPMTGGQMNLSFTDIVVKSKPTSANEAFETIAKAMDTVQFSKWQLMETLPALGELAHVSSQNPQLGALVKTTLNDYTRELGEGMRQKAASLATTVLDVEVDKITASHSMLPDGGQTLNDRAGVLLSDKEFSAFSDIHCNGATTNVPLLQRCSFPGDGMPPCVMALVTEARTFNAPFFVEPLTQQIQVSGNYVTILCSLFVASTLPAVDVENSTNGPYVESAGICVGTNKSLLQLGLTFGTALREKAVMACDILKFASMVIVPKIIKVEPNTDQFAFKSLPFSDGFVLDMVATLEVTAPLVSEEWVKKTVLKGGVHVEYKIGNSAEDNAKKLQKKDMTTKETTYAPPPTFDLSQGYAALTESTVIFSSLADEIKVGESLEYRVLYPGVIGDLEAASEAMDGKPAPTADKTEGETLVNAWLGSGDDNAKRLKIMAEAIVYVIKVNDGEKKLFGTTPPFSDKED